MQSALQRVEADLGRQVGLDARRILWRHRRIRLVHGILLRTRLLSRAHALLLLAYVQSMQLRDARLQATPACAHVRVFSCKLAFSTTSDAPPAISPSEEHAGGRAAAVTYHPCCAACMQQWSTASKLCWGREPGAWLRTGSMSLGVSVQ